MTEKFDARKKVARTTEQEYAHNYTQPTQEEQYQYPNEDSRVKYQVTDESDSKNRDELYGISPEDTTEQPQNRIRVRMNSNEIAEDHRQKAYKIRNVAPVYTKADPGSESYALSNDPRQDEIERIRETSKSFAEQINEEHEKNLTSPSDRYSVDYKENEATPELNVGDKVAHVEENIKGTIKFVNNKRITVAWEDNTRERFSLGEALEFLKKVEAETSYVQEEVDPLHTNEKLSGQLDNSLTDLELDNNEDVEDIDLEKVKLRRRVNELETKANQVNIDQIKKKAAKEVIELMQKKGMCGTSKEAVDAQMFTILQMDDTAFETFKNVILSSTTEPKVDEDDIYAILGENEDFSDIEDGQEYARAREEMKKSTKASRSVDGIEMGDTSFFENGGLANFKGNVGDFSSMSSGMSSSASGNETRNLSSTASNRKHKTIEKKASGLDYSGFQNLQGLTTPINIPNKDMSMRGKFADLFDSMGWSGTPKNNR